MPIPKTVGDAASRKSRETVTSDTGTVAASATAIRISAVARAPFKFSARTRVGFSDTDAQGIVYYGRYNPYFDLARVEYLRQLELLHREAGGDFVMRANDVEYFAPARFDDELEIDARVSRLGRTSVTFEFAAYRLPEATLMVTAHQTLVYVDLHQRTARPVPDDYRAQVTAFEGADVEH
jgi:acyl-CoA thioester hydrolase